MSELYITAVSSLNSPLIESTRDFSKVIQRFTTQIHNEVIERIGIDSRLTVPSDMTEMFKSLIFMTSRNDEEISIPLDMRGDGIQSRHIPIILKYLADEDQKTRNQGSSKVTSIWGYEEPENGIELLKSFEVANSFLEYSQEIQIFVTTHSPAFYKQEEQSPAKVFYVRQNEARETTISDTMDAREIGDTMGLLPLVAPYILEMEQKVSQLKAQSDENYLRDVPTVFVEGKTDKQYLELAISLFSPRLKNLLESDELVIYSKKNEGGCKEISNWVHTCRLKQ